MDPSLVTIVVLNWNHREATLACLASLQRAELGGAAITVVDNGSRDGSVDAIRGRFAGLPVIALPENRGYAGGNNAGIRAALETGCEGILLLNNDTEVAPDFLTALIAAMRDAADAAAVCSAIHRHDRPEMLDVAYSEVHFDQRDAVQILGVNSLPGQGFDTRREIQVAIGCSLLLRAEAVRRVGLFDESYFAYHEDVDWCLRARRAGYRFYYEPLSRVFHRSSSSTTRLHPPPLPDPDSFSHPDLPNAEPMPWNPVRTYLGARNLIRLLRTYASRDEKRAFARACVDEIPLEFFAILLHREGWLRLGRWHYADVFYTLFIAPHPMVQARPGGPGLLPRLLLFAVLFPFDLVWTVPRRIWRAQREGRLKQFTHYIRGLWDGVRDRPLPLVRLGLR
jgi:GT2 family glycosyltransferase